MTMNSGLKLGLTNDDSGDLAGFYLPEDKSIISNLVLEKDNLV